MPFMGKGELSAELTEGSRNPSVSLREPPPLSGEAFGVRAPPSPPVPFTRALYGYARGRLGGASPDLCPFMGKGEEDRRRAAPSFPSFTWLNC